MIERILRAGWTFLTRLFGRLFEFFGSLFGHLFQLLFDFLRLLLRPIFVVIGLLLYVVYKIAELAVTLIQLFLALGRMLVMFVKGLFQTLLGFSYSGSTPNSGSWTPIFRNVSDGLNYFQFDKVAYVLVFLIFFATGFIIIRQIGSIRNGGD